MTGQVTAGRVAAGRGGWRRIEASISFFKYIVALQTSPPHDGVMATTRSRGGWHAKDTGGPGAHGGRQGGARARGEDQDRAGAAGGQGPHAAAGADGRSLAEIARSLGANADTVALCVRRHRGGGAGAALSDAARSGRPASIGDGDRAWVVSLACQRPCELGHPAETRAQSALAAHAGAEAARAGHPALARDEVHGVVDPPRGRPAPRPGAPLPRAARPRLRGGDARGARRLPAALVPLRRRRQPAALGGRGAGGPRRVVSVDEKPGTRAIAPVAPDAGPEPGVRGGALLAGSERRRLGTASPVAGTGPRDGTAGGIVRERHRSREFAGLPGALDARYPEGHAMRLVPGDHPVRRPGETRAWLEGHPGRFGMVSARGTAAGPT